MNLGTADTLLYVMLSDRPKKRFWPRLIVITLAGSIIALAVVWRTPLGLSVRGISSFEFVNESDRLVSNLDLEFICIAPGSGEKFEEYSRQFSRHFTNVPPGCSVTVRSRTPVLMLTSLEARHRPRVSHIGSNVFEGPYWSAYSDTVASTPANSLKLCLISPGEITRAYER